MSPSLSFGILIALGGDRLVRLFTQQNLSNTITNLGGDNVDVAQPWPGRWLDLSLEYKSGTTKTVSLTVPGARTLVVTLPDSFVATDPQVAIGPFCEGDLTRVTFDDFATWLTP